MSIHFKYAHVKLFSSHGLLLDLTKKLNYICLFINIGMHCFMAISFINTNWFTIQIELRANWKLFRAFQSFKIHPFPATMKSFTNKSKTFQCTPGSANRQTIMYGQFCYFLFVCFSMYKANSVETVNFIPIISICIEALNSIFHQPWWNQTQICLSMLLLESVYLHLILLYSYFEGLFY